MNAATTTTKQRYLYVAFSSSTSPLPSLPNIYATSHDLSCVLITSTAREKSVTGHWQEISSVLGPAARPQMPQTQVSPVIKLPVEVSEAILFKIITRKKLVASNDLGEITVTATAFRGLAN